MKKILFSCLLFAAGLAFADQWSFEMEKIGEEMVPKVAKLGNVTLNRLGTAIREKTFLAFPVKVYRTSLFGNAEFERTKGHQAALGSLTKMPHRLLHLKFLRTVSANDILKSFEAALLSNKVKDSAQIKDFKNMVKQGGNIAKGNSVIIAVDYEAKKLIWENANVRKEISGNDELFRDVFSIWFGESSDQKLASMRDAIIRG